VAGSLNSYDAVLCTLAKETGWVIVGVEYRLAPEHPYPAGLHDCYAALCHVGAKADRFGLDAARIVVAGDSAGPGVDRSQPYASPVLAPDLGRLPPSLVITWNAILSLTRENSLPVYAKRALRWNAFALKVWCTAHCRSCPWCQTLPRSF
jgi:acetyl esterase/lipase